jgi:hypothetical protein
LSVDWAEAPPQLTTIASARMVNLTDRNIITVEALPWKRGHVT